LKILNERGKSKDKNKTQLQQQQQKYSLFGKSSGFISLVPFLALALSILGCVRMFIAPLVRQIGNGVGWRVYFPPFLGFMGHLLQGRVLKWSH
jgi:hypothetical protein